MISTSDSYINYVTGNLRKFTPKVIIPTDYSRLPEVVNYDGGSPISEICKTNQTSDNIVYQTYAWNTLERNRIDASGKWVIYNNNARGEFGWIGSEMCNSSGVFSTTQWVKLVFDDVQSFTQFYIHFDYHAKEYAKRFTITFYDRHNNAINQFVVTDNDNVSYKIEYNINYVLSMKLEVFEWSKGNRRCKIIEMSEIDVFQFDDSVVDSLELTDSISIMKDSFETSEIKISLNNVNHEFDLLNPNSIVESSLSKKQKVQASLIGNNVEIRLGNKYIYSRTVNNQKCEIVCRDIFGFTDNVYRPRSIEITNAYSLFEEMFNQAGIYNYHINETLNNVQVNQLVVGLNFREALQQLANASESYLRNGRNGEVYVDLISELSKNINAEYNKNTQVDILKINQEDDIDSVEISYSEFVINEEDTMQVIIDDFQQDLTFESEFILDFGKIITNIDASVSPEVDFEIYNNCIKFIATQDATYTIRVIGDIITTSENIVTVKDKDYNKTEVTNDVKTTNNFCCYVEQAKRLGKNMISFSKRRRKIAITETGRPDVETGDVVSVETDWGVFEGIVIKQNLKYDGILRGYPEVLLKGSE